MRTANVNTPDGKTITLNIPDDASPEQIHGAVQAAVSHYQQANPTAKAPSNGPTAEMAAEAANPNEMLKTAAPSNMLKMAGVAAANAPGIASLASSMLPGANPSAIPQAVANIAQNPSQGLQGARRATEVAGGADYANRDEKILGRVGQGAGMAIEMAGPAQGAANGVENAIETKAAQKTMQAVPTPGARVVASAQAAAPRMLPEPLPRAPEIDKVTGEAADKLNKSINFLTDKAKAKYKLAQKVFGVDAPQESTQVRSVDEIKAALDEVAAATKPSERIVGRNIATGTDQTEMVPAMSKQDRLKTLWQLDKELTQNINYRDPASQQGIFNIQKQIRSEMDKLPGGKKLAEMRSEYSEMKGLQDELGAALQDPAKQKVILQKIASGELKGSTNETNAARSAAIGRLEKMTQGDVMSPVRGEYAQKQTYDAAVLRRQNADRLFQNEQRKAMFKAAQDAKDWDKALKALKQEDDAHAASDAKLLKRMAAENPEGVMKRKMIDALKYLGKAAAVGAIGGTAAKTGFHLMGD